MDDQSYYDILGVSWDASADDIARAYRRRAFERHPDRNPGDPAALADMQRLAEAADMLRDPARRSAYDRMVRGGLAPASPPPASPPRPRCDYFAGDVEYTLTLTPAQARAGASHTLHFHSARGQPYQVAIAVPPGAPDGARIVVPGAGGPARDGAGRGDLIVVVRIAA